MRFLLGCSTTEGCYACIKQADGAKVGYIFYGKDEALRLLGPAARKGKKARNYLKGLLESELPETATESTVELRDGILSWFHTTLEYYSSVIEVEEVRVHSLGTFRSKVLLLMICEDEGDAMLSFVDDEAKHHIAIFHSKRDGERNLAAMPWLKGDERAQIKKALADSALPKTTLRRAELISGKIATGFNCMYVHSRVDQSSAN